MPNNTHGRQNPPKICKSPSLDLKVSFVMLPNVPNRPRIPQDAKVKPPIMPNDRFAFQKYEDPLASMSGICNPAAMRNDRGPAAEGVAHKIYAKASKPIEAKETTMQKALTSKSRTRRYQPLRLQAAA